MIEAPTGEDGVRLAESEHPDLILMDIQLPGADGYEATRRIRANPAFRAIPIIAVTSYALSGDEVKAREAGCDDYVTKPFSPRACSRRSGTPEVRTPARVLIADDNPSVVDILETRLKAHGYETVTAANGEEALGSPREKHRTSSCST